jgi:shikimate kinase
LLRVREPLYRECAHLTIDAEKPVEWIANQIEVATR